MSGGEGPQEARPNVLVIMTDQQSAHMLGCAGTSHVRTPNLDRLAEEGTRFERAYVTFPLCVPSRSSMLTGMMPSELSVHTNVPSGEMPQVRGPNSLAHLLQGAGYYCGYAGKWHAPHPSAAPADGFEWVREFGDEGLTDSVRQFLTRAKDDERPFFLVASFDDPHTICELARDQPSYYGEVPQVDPAAAPNLPANFGEQPYEPEAVRAEQAAMPHMYGTANYGADDWRQYRHAYAQLVERVDARIGAVLASLDGIGEADNTLVIFTSDHGDGDSAHSWNQKTALYEEVIRVPLIIRWPGMVTAGRVTTRLVSTGLDLLPTICAATGVQTPSGLRGRSMLSEDERQSPIVVETGFGASARPRTSGRALIDHRYKYVLYSWGKYREQLHDLVEDPGEQVNLAVEERYAGTVEQYRQALVEWCMELGDEFMLKRLILPQDTPAEIRKQIYAVPY